MPTETEIKKELENLSSFHLLVETYEEIAATRMRRIRDSVLRSRDSLSELASLFQELKQSYRAQVDELLKHKKQPKTGTAFRQHNGKTVAILLSANTGLYGSILITTVQTFSHYVKENLCDIVIVGRYGKTIFEAESPGKHYTYFDLPDSGFTPEQMQKLLELILVYSNIYVFHGQFKSIVTQEPIMDVVSAEQTPTATDTRELTKYLFEPSLEEILVFFEKEIFAAVFEQSIHESDLAKFASRMVTLDQATQNITERTKKMELLGRIQKHRTQNKKQQDRLGGMMLWGK